MIRARCARTPIAQLYGRPSRSRIPHDTPRWARLSRRYKGKNKHALNPCVSKPRQIVPGARCSTTVIESL